MTCSLDLNLNRLARDYLLRHEDQLPWLPTDDTAFDRVVGDFAAELDGAIADRFLEWKRGMTVTEAQP